MLGPQVLINLTALPHAGIDPIRLAQGREIITHIVAPGPPKWFGPNSIILYTYKRNWHDNGGVVVRFGGGGFNIQSIDGVCGR